MPVRDLLNPTVREEKRKHKLKRLVQSPNSFFMDVRCPGCYAICAYTLCTPTGGKCKLTEGCSFRKKQD